MLELETAPLGTDAAHAPDEHISPVLRDAREFETQLAALSRGQLAQLKRNIGEPLPGRGVTWFYGLLLQGERVGQRSRNDEIYFLVATLYDFNRLQTPRKDRRWGTLGRSMRLAADASGSNSIKRRFQILLDADFDRRESIATSELGFRLRQTVQWLAGQGVGFDPAQLLYDLFYWSHLNRFVQKKWARDFFVAPAEVRAFTPETTQDPN